MIPVIDMHCDTIYVLQAEKDKGNLIDLRSNNLSADLEKMKKGGYMCQSFAMYTNLKELKEKNRSAWDNAMMLSDIWDQEIEKNSDIIKPVLTGSEIEKNYREGFLSALKSVEEGAVYGGSVEKLKIMYEKGVRKSTITWNFENELGFPNKKVYNEKIGRSQCDNGCDFVNGLKPAGFEVVHEMEKLGIIIDISHLNDAGIREIFKTVKKETPVIASHSNARGVTMHPRNLSDETIKNIADHGGITGINFAAAFMSYGVGDDYTSKISDMIRHMKYIREKGGIDMIGLGSDFDGITNEVEVKDASEMQKLADAMSLDGFSIDEIEKIFYKNALRVYKSVLG